MSTAMAMALAMAARSASVASTNATLSVDMAARASRALRMAAI